MWKGAMNYSSSIRPWLDRSRNEVDMVVTLKNEVIPIEVKYSNEIGKRDLKGLVKFCEEFDTKGIVMTKDILKEDGNILFYTCVAVLVDSFVKSFYILRSPTSTVSTAGTAPMAVHVSIGPPLLISLAVLLISHHWDQ